MKTTEFNANLLNLFDAPAIKEKAAPKDNSRMKLRFTLQDAKAWASKQPRAFAGLRAIFISHDADLCKMLNIKVTPATEKTHEVLDLTNITVPDTREPYAMPEHVVEILDECAELKAAFKAFKASLEPAK